MSGVPRVSILLPVRDAAASLPRCLDSLRAQTFPDWECLAVDDGSCDGTAELLREASAADPRFRPLAVPAPAGIVAALEMARLAARAPLLLRQDADDASDPERIERQVRAIDEAGGDLALLGCRVRVPGAVTDGMRRYLDWLDACVTPEDCAREIWIESPLVHPTVLARAGAIAAAGGYRDRLWPEDYDLWLRVHRAGGRMANLPDRLYEWNDRPDRLSRTDPRYAPESFLRCRLHHLRRWLATRAGPDRPLVVWGAGRDGRRFVREWDREASGEGPPAPPVVAFVDIDPEKVGRSRFGRPVLDFAAARAGFPGAFYLAAVGVAGARELIRELLREAGMVETVDFVCVH